jgi:diaminopimelate decarboxylase
VNLVKIVETLGSPAYVYNLADVREAYQSLVAELPISALVYYSLKANPHPGLVAQVHRSGGRAEISSEGELDVALTAGVPGDECLYSGPGKTQSEVSRALEAGVRLFSVESARDLRLLDYAACDHGVEAEAIIRINPNGVRTHARLTMTGTCSQFGIDEDQLNHLPTNLSRVKVTGIHCYLGSHVTDLFTSFTIVAETAARVARQLGIRLCWLDMGGGFGHPYAVAGVRPELTGLRNALEHLLDVHLPSWRVGQPQLVFESGRYLVGGCGNIVGTVLDVKESRGRRYAVLDFGINHLGGMSGLRRIPRTDVTIESRVCRDGLTEEETTFVGPLCTPLDVVATARSGPRVQIGDIVSIPNVGAYGLSASLVGFLSRPAPIEVLVDGGRVVDASVVSAVRERRKQ